MVSWNWKARYGYISCKYMNAPIDTRRAGLLLASNNTVEKLLCMFLVWYLNIPTAFRTSWGCEAQKAAHIIKWRENCGCSGKQSQRALSMYVRCLHGGWPKNGAKCSVCEGSPMDNTNISPWPLEVARFHPFSYLCYKPNTRTPLLFLIHCYVGGSGK